MSVFHQIHTEAQILHNHILAYPPHLHRAVEFVRLLSGDAVATLNGVSYTMRPGDFILVFPDVIHGYTVSGEVEVEKLIFLPEEVSTLDAVFTDRLPALPHITENRQEKTTIPALTDEIFAQYEASSPAVRKAYLALLSGKLLEVSGLTRRESVRRDATYAILDYCRLHYRENISLQSVADALFFSRSYVSHIFCEKLNIHFCKYLNDLRLEAAIPLLLSGNFSVEEVAERCGFSSPRSFYRTFSDYTGATPKQYALTFAKKRE